MLIVRIIATANLITKTIKTIHFTILESSNMDRTRLD